MDHSIFASRFKPNCCCIIPRNIYNCEAEVPEELDDHWLLDFRSLLGGHGKASFPKNLGSFSVATSVSSCLCRIWIFHLCLSFKKTQVFYEKFFPLGVYIQNFNPRHHIFIIFATKPRGLFDNWVKLSDL